jgi:hypothetical protein
MKIVLKHLIIMTGLIIAWTMAQDSDPADETSTKQQNNETLGQPDAGEKSSFARKLEKIIKHAKKQSNGSHPYHMIQCDFIARRYASLFGKLDRPPSIHRCGYNQTGNIHEIDFAFTDMMNKTSTCTGLHALLTADNDSISTSYKIQPECKIL